VAFQKSEGSDYFGYIKNNVGDWVKINVLNGDCLVYYKVSDLSTTSLVLSLKIGLGYTLDNGTYRIRAHRFTSGCSATESGESSVLTINLLLPTPTPTLSPEPTSTDTPTPTPSPTPTPTATVKPTPTPTKKASPTPSGSPEETPQETTNPDILGLRDSLKTTPTPEPEKPAKISPFVSILLIVFGGLFLIGGGVSVFLQAKKGSDTPSDNFPSQN